jgi:hypothetical protein
MNATSLFEERCVADKRERYGEAAPYDLIVKPCIDQFSGKIHSHLSGRLGFIFFISLIPLVVVWFLGWMFSVILRGFRPHRIET